MKKLFSKEVIIGICATLTVLILVFGIDYLKGVNVFKASNYYYISYTNVAGLAQSAPVTLNGYKVGQVREIEYEFNNPGHVKVEVSLDKALQVPEGTKASLISDMLGTATIELKMPENVTKFVPVGSTIEGVVPKGLMDNIANEVMPGVSNMIPKVDSLITGANMLIASEDLRQSIARLNHVMANLETSTASLARIMSQITPVASKAGTVMTNATEITENLNQISRDLTSVSSTLKDMPLDSTLNHINRITSDLAAVTAAVNSKDSSIGKLLYSDAFYNNINNTVSSLDSLFIDIKKNPKRYISIKLL